MHVQIEMKKGCDNYEDLFINSLYINLKNKLTLMIKDLGKVWEEITIHKRNKEE